MRPPLLALSLVALSCRQNFPPPWKVDGLRILTVTLDPPEIGPGETTRVRILAVDTQSRPRTVRWSACPPTVASVTMANFLCDSPLEQHGDTESFELTAPRIPGNFPVIPVNLRVAVCAGAAVNIDADGGAQCAGSDSRIATRTLRIQSGARNHNPGVTDVLFDTNPWPESNSPTVARCPAGAMCEHTVRVVLAADAREMYDSAGDGGVSIPEQITTRFYTTHGTLEGGERSDPSETVTSDMQLKWTPPAEAGVADFWFVIDDGRGGVTALTRRLVVTP